MEELRQLIDKLNNEFVKTTGENYYKLDTAEEFTQTEVNKYISLKVEEFNLTRQAESNVVAREYGIETDQRIINSRSKKKKGKKLKERYDGGDFNMVYRKENDEFMGLKLTLIEEGVFSRLCKFIQYPTNCIMIEENVPTIELLMKIMDLKERTLRGHLKTLENKGVLKMIQFGHKKAIYINPKYVASGKDLDLETLKIFNLVECDEEKINNYL